MLFTRGEKVYLSKQNITKMLFSFLLSIIIFYSFSPSFAFYVSLIIILWGIAIVNFDCKKNYESFFTGVIINCAILITYILMKSYKGTLLEWNDIDILLGLFNCLILECVLFGIFCNSKENNKNYSVEKKLYPQRQDDLNRIKEYLKLSNVIGVNGVWGSGKTFLTNELKKTLNTSEKSIFIEIDLLSCNLDEIQTILLNELERKLIEHKILPKNSKQLKTFINDNVFNNYFSMLFMNTDKTYSESLNRFIKEIELMEKTIIIFYEDIDRISNIDIIKKIFSISEKLTNNNIKIIYQYDSEKLGLDKEYIEKYIPYIVNLTPIKFKDVLRTVLKQEMNDDNILSIEDFIYLTLPIYVNYSLKEKIGIDIIGKIDLDNVAIRKVENFIKELRIILSEKDIYKEKENKKIAINFYFIKNFFPKIYEYFSIQEGLLDSIKFNYKDLKYSILEIISKINYYNEGDVGNGFSPEQIDELFLLEDNSVKLIILSMFDYNFQVDTVNNDYKEIDEGKINNSKLLADNEKKDRLIWNLLCNGKSEYTNYQAAADYFCENVLYQDKYVHKEAYKIFQEKMYEEQYCKSDNETIILIGVSSFLTLAEAFNVSNKSNEDWKKFIDFYFIYDEIKEINIDLIQILNYCPLNSNKLYIEILNRFNNLRIIGNMNKNINFKVFIKKYIKAISSLGYVRVNSLWRLDIKNDDSLDSEMINNIFKDIEKEMVRLRLRTEVTPIKKDIELIIGFMKKIVEIIEYKEVVQHIEPRITTNLYSRYVNQEEFDKLYKFKKVLKPEAFMMEVEKSYENDLISPYEVDSLLSKLD